MVHIISPTGKGIRVDSEGDGHFGSRRGDRTHNGTDFICVPGQDVVSPCSGIVLRVAYPYHDDPSWKGIVIDASWCKVVMFYLDPFVGYPSEVYKGQPVGYAQDISKRYGPKMTPHIHLRLESVTTNPEMFLGGEE